MGVELREDLGSKLVPEITDQFDPLPSNEQVTQFFSLEQQLPCQVTLLISQLDWMASAAEAPSVI